MFGDVWRWAGRYRATERNIGVDPFTIAVEVHNLLGGAAYWPATAGTPAPTPISSSELRVGRAPHVGRN